MLTPCPFEVAVPYVRVGLSQGRAVRSVRTGGFAIHITERSVLPEEVVSPVTHIGLVGCGKWGRFILRDLLALGCRVTVVARSDATARRAKEGGATAIVGAVGDLPDVDGAVVAVPAVEHASVVDALVPREVPIFVEKPLTTDPFWARRIAAVAQDRVFVMDKWRYHPGVEMLGEISRSGEFGQVVAVETIRTGWGNPHADADGIWHLAPHDLSIALEILGFLPEAHSARADLSDGKPAGIVGFLGDDPWVRIEVGTRSTRRVRAVTVRCQEAIISLMDGYADHLEVLAGYPPVDTPPAPTKRRISTELPLLRELRTFIEHLAGGPPPRSSVAEGAMIVARIAELRQLAGIGERL